MTLDAGIWDCPAERYHADDLLLGTDAPSLSASIANILVNRSPAHARAAHPKLNPDLEREQETKFDIGTAVHALLLQGDDIVRVIPFDEWRTNEAKDLVAAARADGAIPLKPKDGERVSLMVAAAREQMALYYPDFAFFAGGKPEQTLVWEDDHGVICRARLDWLHDETMAIDDYKSTSASSEPERWTRTMYGIGGDVQVAFYRRGVEKLTGIQPQFRYVVQETYPPYALSVVDLAPSALAIADDKVQTAIDLWATCLEQDCWPTYPARVASIELPTWEELRWLDREQEAAA